ncbi:MAG: cytochrome-c peroxidase [Planctomycetota bacterium]|nr:cytochrome-c peroxidase [Planctomycetota bacterium]
MRERAFWIVFFLGLMTLSLAACGGGGAGTDGAVIDESGDTPDVPEEPPITPPVEPSALDQQLLQALEDRDVDTPQAPPIPADALVALGKALFFDKELSGNRNISCATCHHPTTGTGDDLSVSIGQGGSGLGSARLLGSGALIPRNAPPLFNKGLPAFRTMFWDSRVSIGQGGALNTPEPALNGPRPTAGAIAQELTTALAAQAIFPLTSHAEMRGDPGENELADAADNLEVWTLIMDRLVGTDNGTQGGFAEYRALFQAAFPAVADIDGFHIGHVGAALGAYEDLAFRALDSSFDRYLAGDLAAMTDEARRGALLRSRGLRPLPRRPAADRRASSRPRRPPGRPGARSQWG